MKVKKKIKEKLELFKNTAVPFLRKDAIIEVEDHLFKIAT